MREVERPPALSSSESGAPLSFHTSLSLLSLCRSSAVDSLPYYLHHYLGVCFLIIAHMTIIAAFLSLSLSSTPFKCDIFFRALKRR